MPLDGTLDLYPVPGFTDRRYPFFTSGPPAAARAVVFVGGLTNGLGSVPYVGALDAGLSAAGWKLVQPHWSNAYDGYGTGSLDRDVAELSSLVGHLRKQGLTTIVLMGHSTGSQDVLHYLLTSTEAVEGGILQAPVSDREFFSQDASASARAWVEALPLATDMVAAGRGGELMPADFCDTVGMRMTAYRLWSLLHPEGDDDYFSTDLPESSTAHPHPLAATFGALARPVLALHSEHDEFRPLAGRPAPETVLAKWAALAPGRLEWRIVPGASHAVEQEDAQGVLVREVVAWLRRFE